MARAPEPSLLLALDFGGTKHTAAVLRLGERQWQAHRRAFSGPRANRQFDLETMRSLAREVLGDERPAAVGVSFGGPVEAISGVVLLSHHVSGWENVPLREILEVEFGAPVYVDNDANAGALGEHRYGAGHGRSSLLYVTVSTGVGGGWILNGEVWRGAQSLAGEIGHTVVDPSGPPCLCGKRGCVERLASGPYIAQDLRELLLASPDEGRILRHLAGGDLAMITAQMAAEAAALGDEFSRERLEQAAWALGVAIGNALNLMNPELVVLGGGLMRAGDGFWEVIRRTARETALPQVQVEVVPARLGDDSPLWGAAALAEEIRLATRSA